MHEYLATGREALMLGSELLQRARLADPDTGIWEAADLQWWWRRRRASDTVKQTFWLDTEGPVAAALLTSWRDDRWQCDPIVIPTAAALDPSVVWTRACDLIGTHARGVVEVNLRDDDPTFAKQVTSAGLVTGTQWTISWMNPRDRQTPAAPAAGFSIRDQTSRAHTTHPMRFTQRP